MRPLLRILLTVATAISMLLCMVLIVLQVRCHLQIADSLRHFSSDSDRHARTWSFLGSQNGIIWISYGGLRFDDAAAFAFHGPRDRNDPQYQPGLTYQGVRGAPPSSPRPRSFWNRRGFFLKWPQSVRVSPVPAWYINGQLAMPHWFLILLFAILPLLRLIFHIRGRRGAGNLCPVCGYDLRVTTERCPECGTTRQPSLSGAVSP
ncbi:MAG TPA: hypothetical protein VGP99_12330 [Tepidisphaeraceae bacterium]|nr:hypothetical protein [Tepidisphaeraceae bacterium]